MEGEGGERRKSKGENRMGDREKEGVGGGRGGRKGRAEGKGKGRGGERELVPPT